MSNKKYQKIMVRNQHQPKKLIKSKNRKKNIQNRKSQNNSKATKENSLIKLFHVNAAGLKHKAEDLKNKIKYFGSSIISVQETHHRKKGKFKMDKFKVFEAIRKNKEQGGSMLIINEDLNPILIKVYEESFELIVVEIKTENKPIRVITGYGPQENWKED